MKIDLRTILYLFFKDKDSNNHYLNTNLYNISFFYSFMREHLNDKGKSIVKLENYLELLTNYPGMYGYLNNELICFEKDNLDLKDYYNDKELIIIYNAYEEYLSFIDNLEPAMAKMITYVRKRGLI